MKKILAVVGARPNFVKISRFRKEAENFPGIELKIVHTGQHFDREMSDVFFHQFELLPDYFFNVPPATSNTQIAEVMTSIEKLVNDQYRPDLIIVVGDVNSTVAAAFAANRINIRLAHVESGLRSFDRTMPEELNSIIADALADLCFVTEQSGIDNLTREGKHDKQIFFVGNTMIDTLVAYEAEIEKSAVLGQLELKANGFCLVTMHRPATVDNKEKLLKLLDIVGFISQRVKVVFPAHPRTINMLKSYKLYEDAKKLNNLVLTGPIGYFDFQKLIKESMFVMTDSGGVQEETTYRKTPCLTLRSSTERPVTIKQGTNTLVSFMASELSAPVDEIMNGIYKKGDIPELWDGHATRRIFEIIDRVI